MNRRKDNKEFKQFAKYMGFSNPKSKYKKINIIISCAFGIVLAILIIILILQQISIIELKDDLSISYGAQAEYNYIISQKDEIISDKNKLIGEKNATIREKMDEIQSLKNQINANSGNAVKEKTFWLGSTKQEVLEIMGAPDTIYEFEILNETSWYYGTSKIGFKNGVVIDYSVGDVKLKLRY